jgi:D-3-phosphoglycerate dehydrogenase
MKPKILRTDVNLHMIEGSLKDIEEIANVVTCPSHDEQTLLGEAGDADLILTCYDKITARVIQSARKLKGIVKYGVGVDNIDLDEATRRGIPVVNCPEYGSETVADHAFALMICLARRIIQIDGRMRSNSWIWPSPEYLGMDLFGKTLGIIGFGKIGKAMARRAAGFGMKTVAFDPYLKEKSTLRLPGLKAGACSGLTLSRAPLPRLQRRGLARPNGSTGRPDVRLVDLDFLLRFSDVVSIHCVLTPENRGLIGDIEFKKMKKTALLIDVSRAAIIDEAALVRALREGWIQGAGLDVFSEEPLSLHNPLLALDNVILTPHFAWYTKEAFERLESETVQRVLEILQGKTPKNVVNIEVFEKGR